jgi:ribonuclease BN (tRNA processing enzyme)
MRVTVLGCQSPYPGPDGATAGYLVQTSGASLLLDCGSGVLSQLGKYLPITRLDAVILSHYHHDHMADVGVLQYGIMVHQAVGDRKLQNPLPIYGPAEPSDRAFSMHYQEAMRFFPIDDTSELTIGDMQITFLRTDHEIPCYAVRIEADGKSLVYGADSGPDTAWEPFASQADLFICEVTILQRDTPPVLDGHLSVELSSQIGQKMKVKRLLLTHLYPDYTEEEVLREAKDYTYGECLVAKVGLQMQI